MASYTLLNAAQNPGDQLTAVEMYDPLAANTEYLRNPPSGFFALSTGAANLTTASAVMVDLTGYSVTVTTLPNPGGIVQVSMKLMGRTSSNTRFDFLVDGVSITGDSDGLGQAQATGEVTIERIIAVTAALHTYKVQWRSTTGTVTWFPAGLGQFRVVQI